MYDAFTGDLLDRTRVNLPLGTGKYVAEPTVALVYDTSIFGATSPIFGARWRAQISQSVGDLTYTSVLLDVRQYFMVKKPVTIAVRAVHFGRYGVSSDDPFLLDYYAGYQELVRGYELRGFDPTACPASSTASTGNCLIYNNLLGSRMLVANLEVRAPLMGLIKHDLSYGRIPVEVAGFFDAGVTWNGNDDPALAGGDRPLMRSVGFAARANLFGFLMIEGSLAHPLDRPSGFQFQLGIKQGF